jgi:hypothetical protein
MSQSTGGWMNGVVPRGQPYTFAAAVAKVGTLMYKDTTAGQAAISDSTRPIGYAGEATNSNPFAVTDLTKKYPVYPLIQGDKVAFPLLATNAIIAVGDEVELTAGGTIDKKSGAGFVIGVAEDAAAANDGAATATAYLAVRVDFRYEAS